MFAGINTFISTLASEDEARASDLLTPLTSERECNTTLMYRLVSQHLFWDFTNTYSRRRSWSLITLGYRTLFIHWSRFFSSERSRLIAENYVFPRNTRLARRAIPYVVDWPMDCTIPYRLNLFFSRTIGMWISLHARVVICCGWKRCKI